MSQNSLASLRKKKTSTGNKKGKAFEIVDGHNKLSFRFIVGLRSYFLFTRPGEKRGCFRLLVSKASLAC
jgi:hypothetical protein